MMDRKQNRAWPGILWQAFVAGICGRHLGQILDVLAQILHRSWTDLGQEGRENQDSQRREEESHKIGPDRP